MEFGKRSGSNVNSGNEGLGLGFVGYTRSFSFGRKRVTLPNDIEIDSTFSTPTKKKRLILSSEKSALETLPQDILIRILCGVDHDDLEQLFHVSKSIREAALIAKQWHFEYSTPRKTLPFQNPFNLEEVSNSDEAEAPNAPRQSRVHRSRTNGKNLSDISVALFASPEKERRWPKKELSMEMETKI